MGNTYDFSGWATKANIRCSDGRTIAPDAFKHNDGQKVPLVWNHQHTGPDYVLGHALLENRPEGVYAYCKFNDTESGQTGKKLVQHGDVDALSIYANQLKEKMSYVIHGNIREVSLVLAGANMGAHIDNVISHGETSDSEAEIYTDEFIVLCHSDEEINDEDQFEDEEVEEVSEAEESDDEDIEEEETLEHADKEENEMAEKTVKEVFDSMTEEQKTVCYAMIGQALEDAGVDNDEDDDEEIEEEKNMKHNVFDNDNRNEGTFLSHADQQDIIALAKESGVGSLQKALSIYAEENDFLAHGIDPSNIEELFPEFKDVKPGAPELITRDQTWVDGVINGVHKSPISRIRTRQGQADAANIAALGYEKGKEKGYIGNVKLVNRTTDPQTVYVKDKLERDDIIDITDFDVVMYQKNVMRMALNEELAKAIMIGDGREDGDDNKISEDHIRSIWNDDELYTIHRDVDIAAARTELQGTNTAANFGENYIYAEAIITAALYAREQYKGSGSLAFYCTPHLLNVMLLARDLNGRRIYESKSDLAAALNVTAIHTVEQFEGKVRTDKQSKQHKLLGLFVNLKDYQLGATKGGQVTSFEDFDIDFNQYKYLMETRVSGALTKIKSAIALEEPVTQAAG